MDKKELTAVAAQTLDYAKAAGATQAETEINSGHGLSLTVRMGALETLEHTRDRAMEIVVYVGKKKGNVSTSDLTAAGLKEAAQKAVSLAQYAAEDPFAGLPDAASLATTFPNLDLHHPWAISAEAATALAKQMEEAAFAADPRIKNSDGANVSAHEDGFVYANSHGFCAGYESTRHSLYASVIAEQNDEMQGGYWYDSVRCASDLMSPEALGKRAGERAAASLNARRISTQTAPVLFDATLSSGLIGHFVGAVSGGSLYRKTSFLQDALGTAVFPSWFSIEENPFLVRGHASMPFDEEGVAPKVRSIVSNGVLKDYFLGTYAARKLGLASTGNAGGASNLICTFGADSFADMLKKMGRGLYVTDLMGQGVNHVTGDYSRGASGFWVEDGVIAYPVEEITIAGNLRDIYKNIVAVGADVDRRSSKLIGSVLVSEMAIAGE